MRLIQRLPVLFRYPLCEFILSINANWACSVSSKYHSWLLPPYDFFSLTSSVFLSWYWNTCMARTLWTCIITNTTTIHWFTTCYLARNLKNQQDQRDLFKVQFEGIFGIPSFHHRFLARVCAALLIFATSASFKTFQLGKDNIYFHIKISDYPV